MFISSSINVITSVNENSMPFSMISYKKLPFAHNIHETMNANCFLQYSNVRLVDVHMVFLKLGDTVPTGLLISVGYTFFGDIYALTIAMNQLNVTNMKIRRCSLIAK